MELFKNIRLKIGKSILAKKISRTSTKTFYSDFGKVKKIGLVWDASSTEDFSALSRFYQKMHDRNIDVYVLGYFPGKNLPDKYTAIRYLSLIRKTDINSIYHPVSTESTKFINTRFDILIDINFKKLFPLQYILSLSSAAFKIGLYEAETIETPLHMMMDLKHPIDVENYLNQVIYYLEMIKS